MPWAVVLKWLSKVIWRRDFVLHIGPDNSLLAEQDWAIAWTNHNFPFPNFNDCLTKVKDFVE